MTFTLDKTRAAKLEQAFATLKTEFFGIDKQLDEIHNKMLAWYVAPDICIRPTIINLWGMTGVGKTDVVRRLFKLLEYPTYLELVVSRYLVNDINASGASNSNSPVFVFDEIQKYRTKNEKGEEKDENFASFWELLSDGKLSNSHFKARFQFSKILLEDRIALAAMTDRLASKKLPAGELENYKTDFGLPQSLEDLREMSLDSILEEVNKIEEAGIPTTLNVTNSLIFICGNLDEAFKQASNVSDSDNISADYLHEVTKSLTFFDIKEALTCRFAPEQIARFGNNHIIYPSLSKEAFKAIIKNRLDGYTVRFKEKTGVTLQFSPSVVQFIYDGSVFPAQGTRPVLSTIDDFISTVVIKALFQLETSQTILVQVEDNNTICFTSVAEQENLRINYALPVIAAREISRMPEDERIRVAVHEAGHIVMGYIMGEELQYASITPNTSSSKGRVQFKPSDANTSTMYLKCLVGLSGIAAEKIVFGNVSFGSVDDTYKVTSLIADSIRCIGVSLGSAYSGDVCPQNIKQTVLGSDEINETDKEIKRQFEHLQKIVKGVFQFKSAKVMLLNVAKTLLAKEYIISEDLEEILPAPKLQELKGFTERKLKELLSYHVSVREYQEFMVFEANVLLT